MTIEVTDEMVTAFEQAGTESGEIIDTRAGIKAVLAIVERDSTRPEMLSDRLGYPRIVGDVDWQKRIDDAYRRGLEDGGA